MHDLNRRGFLGCAAAVSSFPPAVAADAGPVFDDTQPTQGVVIPESKLAEMNRAPVISKTVTRLWNDSPTIKSPMQCSLPERALF